MTLNQLISSKNYSKAIKICEDLILEGQVNNDNSTRLTGLVYLIIIYTQQKDYDKSKKIIFDNFLEILSECKEYWTGKELIETCLFFNETSKAQEYNNAYLRYNPKDLKALLNKANILYLSKQYKAAFVVLKDINKLDSENDLVYYLLGLIHIALSNESKAFRCFERSFDLGNNKAIHEIAKLLFVRTGECDFENCTDCCCKGVLLKGIDGNFIKNNIALSTLVRHDNRNNCWSKININTKGYWVFECKLLGEANFCKGYENRPEVCHDYPSSILTTRSACSYHFELKNNIPKFKSKNTLNVILHLLKTYGYENEYKKISSDLF